MKLYPKQPAGNSSWRRKLPVAFLTGWRKFYFLARLINNSTFYIISLNWIDYYYSLPGVVPAAPPVEMGMAMICLTPVWGLVWTAWILIAAVCWPWPWSDMACCNRLRSCDAWAPDKTVPGVNAVCCWFDPEVEDVEAEGGFDAIEISWKSEKKLHEQKIEAKIF